MIKNYELKRIDEEVWEKTPEKIQLDRKRFSFIRDEIKKKQRKIERYQKNIIRLKSERKELVKERNTLYHKLFTFQTDNFPSVSPTSQPSNNFQWSINLRLGDIKRKKYLGSNRKVRERLDELKGTSLFTLRMNSKDDLTEDCREEIRKIIEKNLGKEIEKDKLGVFKRWKKDELKMWDYFSN
jgi:hypothetical protein